MNSRIPSTISALLFLLMIPTQACRAIPKDTSSAINPAQLQRNIESLRVVDHFWHKISWKKSLIAGLQESLLSHRPIILWAFIDLPDAEKC